MMSICQFENSSSGGKMVIDVSVFHQVSNMEGRRFIRSIFASQRANNITQVVMNLPKDAAEFLGLFLLTFFHSVYSQVLFKGV